VRLGQRCVKQSGKLNYMQAYGLGGIALAIAFRHYDVAQIVRNLTVLYIVA